MGDTAMINLLYMKPKLTFLLALTFLFLFSGSSVVFGDDLMEMEENLKDGKS